MTRRRDVSVTAGVVAVLVLSVLATTAPPVGVADAEDVVQMSEELAQATDGLVVETPRHGPTTRGIQA